MHPVRLFCWHFMASPNRIAASFRLPEGWAFRAAEVASGSITGTGDISHHHRDCSGALFHIACGPYGIIE